MFETYSIENDDFTHQFLFIESYASEEVDDDITLIVTNPEVTIIGSSSSSESIENVDEVIPVIVPPTNPSTGQIDPPTDTTDPQQSSSN